MKRVNGYRTRLMLAGIVAVVLGGSEIGKADFVFGEPTNLGPTVNSSAIDNGPSVSADSLTLFYVSRRLGGEGGNDIWLSRRSTTRDPWSGPVNLGAPVNSSYHEHGPCISPDGLKLYFGSERPGGEGGSDVWMTELSTTSDLWGTVVNLGPTVNSSASDGVGSISADGLKLFLSSGRSGGSGGLDLYVATRVTTDDPWDPPIHLGPIVNSSATDAAPDISADGLMLFFASSRPGGIGDRDLWVAMRATASDEWSTPMNLGPTVNSTAYDSAPNISADGRTLYFFSERPGGEGGRDIWQGPIVSIVDFNGDGIIDSADMSIIVDHWGEEYSLCDIGPMPWGDGVVDVKDLAVLAEHMGGYQRPVAHWTLDEKEGDMAHDKIGENGASVFGDAAWMPTGGMFGGALFLDGVDDWAFTGPIRQLNSGPFSILAWVKGWAPGRVIISQAMASNWLMADATGNLMTEIKCRGRGDGPLLSETIITDGNWHRIALVWDGSHRTLYVDSAPVAEDVQTGLEVSDTGLNFGVGKDYLAGSYFSGLIDDVRIYDVALNAELIAALTY